MRVLAAELDRGATLIERRTGDEHLGDAHSGAALHRGVDILEQVFVRQVAVKVEEVLQQQLFRGKSGPIAVAPCMTVQQRMQVGE